MSYKDLLVWQEAMQLVQQIYRVVKLLPDSEKYGIRAQICRAVISVAANIAEGHGSSHRKVFLNHLSVSKGSLMEVETYIVAIENLDILKKQELTEIHAQIEKVGKLLNALLRALRSKEPGSV